MAGKEEADIEIAGKEDGVRGNLPNARRSRDELGGQRT